MFCFFKYFQIPSKIPACAGMTLFGEIGAGKGFRLPFAFSQPRHADYALNLAQRRQYARQVVYLFDFQREAHAGF